MNPLQYFENWYKQELKNTSDRIPSACCLGSIGLDGYPNSRTVSLKEIRDDKFVITGPENSRKGKELLQNPRASLTFWWTKTERQVRIQGDAKQIENELAESYFKERNKDSQIVSLISEQGSEVSQIDDLTILFEQKKEFYKDREIQKPTYWSGFYIIPKRIEFMSFRENRFHIRELFIREENNWTRTMLQP